MVPKRCDDGRSTGVAVAAATPRREEESTDTIGRLGLVVAQTARR